MAVSRNRDLLSAAQLSWAYRIPFLFGVFEMFLACRIFRFREKRKKIVENPGNVITSCLLSLERPRGGGGDVEKWRMLYHLLSCDLLISDRVYKFHCNQA